MGGKLTRLGHMLESGRSVSQYHDSIDWLLKNIFHYEEVGFSDEEAFAHQKRPAAILKFVGGRWAFDYSG